MPLATSSDPVTDSARPAHPGRRRFVLATASALLALVASTAIYAATRVHTNPPAISPPASSVLPAGATAPVSFVLARLGGGGEVHLSGVVAGKPAVVNFFASWCTACAAELDAFGAVSRSKEDGVAFVGIDTNDPNHGLAEKMLRAAGITYPVVTDTSNLAVTSAYGVSALPTTFFVNRAGRVVSEVLGAEDARTLASRVTALERSGVHHR